MLQMTRISCQRLHITVQGLFRYLTHALVDYTYDTEQLTEALYVAKAQQQSPNSLGWTGRELRSLQPRILSCYATLCKTFQPMAQFWKLAMRNLPHAFALHVEAAMDPALSAPDDRPDMAPYLAVLGTLSSPAPPFPTFLPQHTSHSLSSVQ